nr:hypothetical protein [Tanacetum cinerariifolium]
MRSMRPNMNCARSNITPFNKSAHSYTNRPFQRKSTVRSQYRAPWVPTVNKNFPPVNRKFSTVDRNFPTVNKKFSTASRKFPTGSTKGPTADMGMKGKAGSSQNHIDDKGYWDSGCSRHMTGNISYLSDYEPFDEGYVSFGQEGCKITGKGTIKTECIVLGRDFKLLDDANILLRTPRQHNMSKDETSDILKKFITEIENLNDLKVKIIRRNRTLIEAARTMLADAKLPVTFWAEAVSTACYVQNKVLVNTSQNKTPYESLNDNLGKFEAKGDEGYFIGYSMSSKAFRVFNKRTRRVKENLHVEFLENKAIEKGAGPNWLFDIDSLTKSMNYVPVDACINSTNLLGTKDVANQEVKKDVSSLRYIALSNWGHDALLESSSSDILKKFRFLDVRSSNTPMDKENPWGKDGTGKDVDLHLYRSMIGSLMYLTASRLDIMFTVCACARHQVTPKECHLHAVKRIF